MLHLIAASFLWAFSFGLIKGQLAGIDPAAVACGRLLLAAAAFAPFLSRAPLRGRSLLKVMGLGAVQFGLMYLLYISAYQYLPAWLVALQTIFTPFYVVAIADVLDRTWRVRHGAAAALAVLGAAVVLAKGLPEGADWRGVLLLQGANLCFALGQVLYPRLERRSDCHESGLMGWMYQGAAAFALAAALLRRPSAEGWHAGAILVLVYLGLVPTAVGFYLWNRGAARVRASVLAAANNLKVPLAVLLAWVVFKEEGPYLKALGGMVLITAAVVLAGTAPGRGVHRIDE